MIGSSSKPVGRSIDRLRQHLLSGDVDDSIMSLVAENGVQLSLPAQCTVYEQGVPGDSFFILLSGQVCMSIEAPDGRGLVVRWLRAPDMFGEACAVCPGPRPLTATTETPCEVFEISHPGLLKLLPTIPALHNTLLRNIADDIRYAMQLVGHNAFKTSRERVAEVLVSLAGLSSIADADWNLRGESHEVIDGWVILPEVSIDDLARMAATSRETASRTVSNLERHGVLKRSGDRRLAISPVALSEVGLPSDGRRIRHVH